MNRSEEIARALGEDWVYVDGVGFCYRGNHQREQEVVNKAIRDRVRVRHIESSELRCVELLACGDRMWLELRHSWLGDKIKDFWCSAWIEEDAVAETRDQFWDDEEPWSDVIAPDYGEAERLCYEEALLWLDGGE